MLPSWIRSRNCRPRLVYFFAIEITRRRLASTISFLAWRACGSQVPIRARQLDLRSRQSAGNEHRAAVQLRGQCGSVGKRTGGTDKLPHICKNGKRSAETGEDDIREAFMRIAIAGLFVASS